MGARVTHSSLHPSTLATAMGQPLLQLLRGRAGGLWEVCIGLEVHAQVLSASKLMSGAAAATLASAAPNRSVSFFDAALPGTLPAVNGECVRQAIRTSLAVGATVHARSLFERKHYFYCDLPLGYQLTQQRAPIATDGLLRFDLPAAAVVSEHAADGAVADQTFDASRYKSRREKNEALRQWKARQQAKAAASPQEVRIPVHHIQTGPLTTSCILLNYRTLSRAACGSRASRSSRTRVSSRIYPRVRGHSRRANQLSNNCDQQARASTTWSRTALWWT